MELSVRNALLQHALWLLLWNVAFATLSFVWLVLPWLAGLFGCLALYCLMTIWYVLWHGHRSGLSAPFPWGKELLFAFLCLVLAPVFIIRKVIRMMLEPLHALAEYRSSECLRSHPLLFYLSRWFFCIGFDLNKYFVDRYWEDVQVGQDDLNVDEYASGPYRLHYALYEGVKAGPLHVFVLPNAQSTLTPTLSLKTNQLIIDYPHCNSNVGMSSWGLAEAHHMAALIVFVAKKKGHKHVVIEGCSLGGFWAPRVAQHVALQTQDIGIEVVSVVTFNRLSDFPHNFFRFILGRWIGGVCAVLMHPIVYVLTKATGYNDGQSILGYHRLFAAHDRVRFTSFSSSQDSVVGLASPDHVLDRARKISKLWWLVFALGGVCLSVALCAALVIWAPNVSGLMFMGTMMQGFAWRARVMFVAISVYLGWALIGSAWQHISDRRLAMDLFNKGIASNRIYRNDFTDHGYPGAGWKCYQPYDAKDGQGCVAYSEWVTCLCHSD